MFKKAGLLFLCLTLLTGALYPLLITTIAMVFMPKQREGSLLFIEDKIRGSTLIGQNFQQDIYFWPRPSINAYDPLTSRGSNLGPTSRLLQSEVQKRAEKLAGLHHKPTQQVPADLVYASASGLYPHISLQAVYFQLDRVIKARNLMNKRVEIEQHIQEMVEGPKGSFEGVRYINVLLLNKWLDEHFAQGKLT